MARRSIVVMSAGLALVGGLSACGKLDQKDKPDASRPPVELLVTAAITDGGVRVSPAEIGGGPVRIVINNQTQRAVRAVLTGDHGGRRATPHKIHPGQNAAIKTQIVRGSYELSAGDERHAAVIAVGARRPSSDGELLLP